MAFLSDIIGFALQNAYYLLVVSATVYVFKLHNDLIRLKAFKGPLAAKFTDL
jgi:hypothetical protein